METETASHRSSAQSHSLPTYVMKANCTANLRKVTPFLDHFSGSKWIFSGYSPTSEDIRV